MKIAVVVHIHYTDTIDLILRAISGSALKKADFYFSLTPSAGDLEQRIKSEIPEATVEIIENKGRDILPFIKLVNKYKLVDGYDAILKLHGKKTVALPGYGAFWLVDSLRKLLPTNEAQLKKIRSELKVRGLLGPAGHLFEYDPVTDKNHVLIQETVKQAGTSLSENHSRYFFGGSMLWFDPDTLRFLTDREDIDDIFPVEDGQRDGTVAHAIERLFTLYPSNVHKVDLGIVDLRENSIRAMLPTDVSIDGLIRSYEEFSNMAVVVALGGKKYTLDYSELKGLQEKRAKDKINSEQAILSMDEPDNLHTLLVRTQEELARIKSSKKYKMLEKIAAVQSRLRLRNKN